jgi:hypothetical protein
MVFPAEMAGESIVCPNCQKETILFIPRPAAPPAPKPATPAAKPNTAAKASEFIIEDQLENLGDTFRGLGIIGAIICGVAALVSAVNGEIGLAVSTLICAAVSVGQGVIIRILFYAISKALRLLTVMAKQGARTQSPKIEI